MGLVQSQERNRSILISRITICAAVGGAIAAYFCILLERFSSHWIFSFEHICIRKAA